MSIQDNKIRTGSFTSSENFRLMTNGKAEGSFGAPFYSYVNEKIIERKLGRAIGLNKGNNSTAWGLFLEQRVHDMLPMGYELLSQVTMPHPEHGSFWCGSQDNVNREEQVVCDTKCYEPQNFAEYNDVLMECQESGDISKWKKEFPKEYWQLISNACIWGYNKIEAILYMPWESELEEIRKSAAEYSGPDQWKYRFIYENSINELSYLPDGNKYYKNLNLYRFEVPQSDKDALTERVIAASKLLPSNY